MCMDDDEEEIPREDIITDYSANSARRALEDEVCAVCCLGVCDNDPNTAVSWCLSCYQPRHQRCAAQSGTSVCCVDSPYLNTMSDNEKENYRIRLEIMHTERNEVIGCDPGTIRIVDEKSGTVEEIEHYQEMGAFETLITLSLIHI